MEQSPAKLLTILLIFAHVVSRCDLDLWPLNLELLQPIRCHALKPCIKFEGTLLIHGWVIDDSARFRLLILGGGARLTDGYQVVSVSKHSKISEILNTLCFQGRIWGGRAGGMPPKILAVDLKKNTERMTLEGGEDGSGDEKIAKQVITFQRAMTKNDRVLAHRVLSGDQLPKELRLPTDHKDLSLSSDLTHVSSSFPASPLSPSITPSHFHSRLKTHLFYKSFPP